eukprot:4388589-Pyramimonas_sp.AAC.1
MATSAGRLLFPMTIVTRSFPSKGHARDAATLGRSRAVQCCAVPVAVIIVTGVTSMGRPRFFFDRARFCAQFLEVL